MSVTRGECIAFLCGLAVAVAVYALVTSLVSSGVLIVLPARGKSRRPAIDLSGEWRGKKYGDKPGDFPEELPLFTFPVDASVTAVWLYRDDLTLPGGKVYKPSGSRYYEVVNMPEGAKGRKVLYRRNENKWQRISE